MIIDHQTKCILKTFAEIDLIKARLVTKSY